MITQVVDREDSNLAVTTEWITSISRRVDELTVIALKTGRYDLPDNVSVYSLGGRSSSSRLLKLVRLWWLVLRSLFRVDGLFIHQGQIYSLLVGPFFRLLGKPVIMWKTHGQLPWTMHIGLWFVNKIVTANKRSFRIDTPKRVITGHGIDTGRIKPSSEAPFPFQGERISLVTAGRISPSKHIEEMIGLVINDPNNEIVFTVIGEPGKPADRHYLKSLKDLSKSEGVSDRVTWLGGIPYDQVPGEVEHHDLFLNFSDTGSVDKAVLEAMALKRPILTTNEAFEEINSLAEFPYYYPELDVEQLLNRALKWKRLNDKGIRRYQQSAREWVLQEHSLDHFADALRGQFDELFNHE